MKFYMNDMDEYDNKSVEFIEEDKIIKDKKEIVRKKKDKRENEVSR